MNTEPKTGVFDTSQCDANNILSSYKTVCNGNETCIKNLQQFCKTHIHTEPERQTHDKLIACHLKCGTDKTCKQQCGPT
jgi:hypothetical protein